MGLDNNNKIATKNDAKKAFRKHGTCSHTFGYLLNREFGHLNEVEEKALDPLAGGVLKLGYQCGMLWGSSLAVGAESFRRSDDRDQAIGTAITATQHVMDSFTARTKAHDCADIAACDWASKIEMAKYMITGRFLSCFKLAQDWAPEAIQAAEEGLSNHQTKPTQPVMNCASEVVKKMGGSDEEAVMVAGFAGGLGLSGNACGALSAAIWMKAVRLQGEQPGKTVHNHPDVEDILEKFYIATDYEIQCEDICGQRFKTVDEHSEYIKNGGCKKVIDVLADS
jgi:Putative redox-active protein (C_GCAxxG_C_C)